MSNCREMTPQKLRNGSRKNFKLLKYEHIILLIQDSDGSADTDDPTSSTK